MENFESQNTESKQEGVNQKLTFDISKLWDTPCVFVKPIIEQSLSNLEGSIPDKLRKSMNSKLKVGGAIEMFFSLVDEEELQIIKEFFPNLVESSLAQAAMDAFYNKQPENHLIKDDHCLI